MLLVMHWGSRELYLRAITATTTAINCQQNDFVQIDLFVQLDTIVFGFRLTFADHAMSIRILPDLPFSYTFCMSMSG